MPEPCGDVPDREALASQYLDVLPFDPYPVQEEALLAWFTHAQGVLVTAPTGTGKTLIAEAGIFEALHTGRTVYYTTPLIALTEQKFREMQQAAVGWGFAEEDIGLVTGSRLVNPQAKVLVVVAEILLNRLLHGEAFDFADVSAVVMDEFHSFNDRERGIVWELSLALLPPHVRLLLLSATVGNARQFLIWLDRAHGRKLELVEGSERRVPLEFHWAGESLLVEQLAEMAAGDEAARRTPALVFCFNREACWTAAEQLKGKSLLADGQQKLLAERVAELDFSTGAGSKLKRLLMRGVGVHHAGVLPRYRRIVEGLFQEKLLSVCVCTETLASGINLPARSVVLTSLLKGPPGDKKLVDASSAHQMFGRAGRPQFDDRGYVYAMAHEDDVKIARWREKYDAIPEKTKDPGLIKAKKKLKKKMPKRRTTEQYWNASQFRNLEGAPAANLSSRGPLPWRLLAYWLKLSPDVREIRAVLHKRLLEPKRIEEAEKDLERMLGTLRAAGYVTLEPEPPAPGETPEARPKDEPSRRGLLGLALDGSDAKGDGAKDDKPPPYRAERAVATPTLDRLLPFRSVNPLYAVFLVDQLGIADADERVQALESVLDVAGSLAYSLHVPDPDELPPGPLAVTRLDPELISRGLLASEEEEEEEEDHRGRRPPRVPPLAAKLRMLFDVLYPGVGQLRTRPIWMAGELGRMGGDFEKLIASKNLVKQEGVVFRQLLRLALLCGEFAQVAPAEIPAEEWREQLQRLADDVTEACRRVDRESTDKFMENVGGGDVVEKGEVRSS